MLSLKHLQYIEDQTALSIIYHYLKNIAAFPVNIVIIYTAIYYANICIYKETKIL